MPLKPIKTPFSALEIAQKLNDNFTDIDKGIDDIKTGKSIVEKAHALEPLTAPGNDKYYGTSPAGAVGWLDFPVIDGEVKSLRIEQFTSDDSRWGSALEGVYTLTIPHGGSYPVAAFKQDDDVYSQVSVDLQRDNTNVLLRAMSKFNGYLVVG